MEVEMEVRADMDVDMGMLLTPPIPPLAHCLLSCYIDSNCLACFRPLPENCVRCDHGTPKPCPIAYCCDECFDIDHQVHLRSGECQLLSLGCSLREQWLRLTVRFLYVIPQLPVINVPKRVVGLVSHEEEEVLDREDETLLCRVLRGDHNLDDIKLVYFAVKANSVQIMLEGVDYGSGLYPPAFSWFNHSCVPEAAWNFDFHDDGTGGAFLVSPYGGNEEIVQLWRSHFPGFVTHGPKISIRSILPLRSGQPVHISYINNVDTKGKFYPICERCGRGDFPWMLLDVMVGRATAMYDRSEYDACIQGFGQILHELFNFNRAQLITNNFQGHTLHPLHCKMLEVYVSLKPALKESAIRSFAEDDEIEGRRLRKTEAAISLLSACAYYNLFRLERSFVNHLGLEWLEAGDSLLAVYGDLGFAQPREIDGKRFSCDHPKVPAVEAGPFAQSDFKRTWQGFAECIGNLVVTVWPLLITDIPYLQSVKDPFDLEWLECSTVIPQAQEQDTFAEYDRGLCLEQLAFHCYGFGSYFMSVTCGSNCRTLLQLRDRLEDEQ